MYKTSERTKGQSGGDANHSQQVIQANWPTEGGKSQILSQETAQEGLKLWVENIPHVGRRDLDCLLSINGERLTLEKASITKMGGFINPNRMGIGYGDGGVTGKHSKIHSTSVAHGSSGQRICK